MKANTRAATFYCEELQNMVTKADCALARELVARAKVGTGAFNAPNPIIRGETVLIQLVLAPPPSSSAKPPSQLTPAEIVDLLPGKTVEFAPIVGHHMAAELSGDGFGIVAKSPREQEVLPQSLTTWEWSVTPKVKGLHTLILKTVVEAKLSDGKRYALRRLTTNKTIEVTVDPVDEVLDFFDLAIIWLKKTENLLAAVVGLVTAAMALWLALRKRG
jgi:hypothetical protein